MIKYIHTCDENEACIAEYCKWNTNYGEERERGINTLVRQEQRSDQGDAQENG